jgi:ATP synthase F1 complex assembly factor 1
MSASPSLVIRRIIGPSTSLLRTQSQRPYARVHDVRFVTTHRDSERILEKYRDKLEQKAKQYIFPHLLPL